MTTVTLAEARDRLPELIRMMAAGEKVVIEDGGKWVAALAAPPPPPPPEEIAAAHSRALEAFRAVEALRGTFPGLPEGTTVQDLLDEERQCV